MSQHMILSKGRHLVILIHILSAPRFMQTPLHVYCIGKGRIRSCINSDLLKSWANIHNFTQPT